MQDPKRFLLFLNYCLKKGKLHKEHIKSQILHSIFIKLNKKIKLYLLHIYILSISIKTIYFANHNEITFPEKIYYCYKTYKAMYGIKNQVPQLYFEEMRLRCSKWR